MDLSVRRALAHSEKCGTAFDWSVDYWHEYYTGGPAKEPVGAERLRVFGDALRAVGARGQWLDAGCGIGEMARHFRRAGLGVCGIDTSAALIEEAQRVTGLPLVASSRAADSADSPLFVSPRISSRSGFCSENAAAERAMICPACSANEAVATPRWMSGWRTPSSVKKTSLKSGS